jgi:hypothetical protein
MTYTPEERKREAERSASAKHQARTLKAGAELEGRLSRTDEQAFADRENERREAEDVERMREQSAQLADATAQLRKAVDKADAALGDVRGMLHGPAWRNEIRYIDRCRRVLRNLSRDRRLDG